MLQNRLNEIKNDKILMVGILTLLTSAALLVIWQNLFIVAFLSITLSIICLLPQPKPLNSYFSCLLVGILIVFGFLQIAAAVQFFVLPTSNFMMLGLLTIAITLIAVLFWGKGTNVKKNIFTKQDVGALIVISFFILPFAFIAFRSGLESVVGFGSLQSPDGSAHNTGINEMMGSQHLTYKTNPTYYPKGFHLAQAFVTNSFGASQNNQTWSSSAVLYVFQYFAWGAILAGSLFYVGLMFLGKIKDNLKISHIVLLSLLIGPSISLFYLLHFAQEGFLNFYYICSALTASLLFLPYFDLKKAEDKLFVLLYFVFGFGIAMSWGPLVLPIVFAMPILFVLQDIKISTIKDIKKLFNRKYLTVIVGYLILLVPLYIHFKYSDETSFVAEGSIRIFNFALILASVSFLIWAIISEKLKDSSKKFLASVFLPCLITIGLLVAAQYIMAGQPRYYSIKTSYVFEMIAIVIFAATLTKFVVSDSLDLVKKWIVVPICFGMAVFIILSAAGNPLLSIRKMLGSPEYFKEDIAKITNLATKGSITGQNVVVLHYVSTEDKISGSQLITNWVGGINPNSNTNSKTADCNGVIYNKMTYGTGSKVEQEQITNAVNKCIEAHADMNIKYYIITDEGSKQKLIDIFGNKAIFL